MGQKSGCGLIRSIKHRFSYKVSLLVRELCTLLSPTDTSSIEKFTKKGRWFPSKQMRGNFNKEAKSLFVTKPPNCYSITFALFVWKKSPYPGTLKEKELNTRRKGTLKVMFKGYLPLFFGQFIESPTVIDKHNCRPNVTMLEQEDSTLGFMVSLFPANRSSWVFSTCHIPLSKNHPKSAFNSYFKIYETIISNCPIGHPSILFYLFIFFRSQTEITPKLTLFFCMSSPSGFSFNTRYSILYCNKKVSFWKVATENPKPVHLLITITNFFLTQELDSLKPNRFIIFLQA